MRTYTIKEIQDACMQSGMSLYATTCLLNKLKSMPSEQTDDSKLVGAITQMSRNTLGEILDKEQKSIATKGEEVDAAINDLVDKVFEKNKDFIEELKKQSGLISDQTLPVFPLERRHTKKNPDGSITFIHQVGPHFIRTNSITIKDEGEE